MKQLLWPFPSSQPLENEDIKAATNHISFEMAEESEGNRWIQLPYDLQKVSALAHGGKESRGAWSPHFKL